MAPININIAICSYKFSILFAASSSIIDINGVNDNRHPFVTVFEKMPSFANFVLLGYLYLVGVTFSPGSDYNIA